MEEKKLEHPEERQEEKQEKKKQYPVTRRDFYGCVIILLIAIFLQGMQTRALIRRGNTQLENSIANRISSVRAALATSRTALRLHCGRRIIPFGRAVWKLQRQI